MIFECKSQDTLSVIFDTLTLTIEKFPTAVSLTVTGNPKIGERTDANKIDGHLENDGCQTDSDLLATGNQNHPDFSSKSIYKRQAFDAFSLEAKTRLRVVYY